MTQKNISAYAIPGLRLRYQEMEQDKFNELLKLVADCYGIASEEILAKPRTAPLPYIRMLIIYYIRRNYSLTSTTQLGRFMNNRDHTTVIHSTQQFQNKLDTDELLHPKLKSEYATVCEDYLHISKYLNSCL